MKSILNTFKKIKRVTLACILGVATLTITACSEKPSKPPVPQAEPVQLFQQQRTALEKAKSVEQSTIKNAEDLKEKVEQQTQ